MAYFPLLVQGPTSAVDNHVVLFNGTTGDLIKDGGVLLSAIQLWDRTSTTLTTHTAGDSVNLGAGNLIFTTGDIKMPATSFIQDGSGNTAVYPHLNQLQRGGIISVDWAFGRAYDVFGTTVVMDWRNYFLGTASGGGGLDWNNGFLYKNFVTLDWASRNLQVNGGGGAGDNRIVLSWESLQTWAYDGTTMMFDWSNAGYNSSAAISFETQKAKFTNAITDHTNNNSIETDTRELFASSSSIMFDWSNAGFNASAAISFDTQKAIFLSPIADHAGANSIDTDNRFLYSALSGNPTADWAGMILIALDSSQSVCWNDRLLKATDGSTIIMDWSGTIGASALVSFDTPTGNINIKYNISDNSNNASISPTGRFLYDAGAGQSLDWANRSTLDSGDVESINWQSRDLFDIVHNQSLNWQSRYLLDSANGSAVDWEARWLLYSASSGGNASLVWEAGEAHAQDSSLSIGWNGRILYDGSNATSVYWGSRELISFDGSTEFLNWSGTYDVSAAISSDGGTIAFSGNTAYHASYIQDAGNFNSISPASRQLITSDGSTVSADWENGKLGADIISWIGGVNLSYALSFEAQNAIFKTPISDHTNNASIDTSARQLYATDGGTSIMDFSGQGYAGAKFWADITNSQVGFGYPIASTSGYLSIDTNNRQLIGSDGSTTAASWQNGYFEFYAGNTTEGIGLPAVRRDRELLAQTTTVGSVANVAVPNDSVNHTYEVGGWINVTSVILATVKLQVSFIDPNGVAQTADFFGEGLTTAAISTTGFVPLPTMTIRVNPNTTVNVTSIAAITTGITYDVGATVKQLS